ncbi:MAG: universal stress protein [Actinomycetales bacterium]|nr:universal stress protein [Actinomycetales bacterium]
MTDRPYIVVGADGSDLSVDAVRWAVEHARRIGAEVRVVTAFDIPWTILVVPTYTDEDYARDAREMLDATVSRALPEGTDVPLVTELLQARPALALATAAAGAELLVVGSQGRGELPGMHLGSVATYCVHHAPCPVVVVRRTVDLP